MFGFTPPPTPQEAPVPCPHCAGREAIALYATTRTEYLRCVACRQVWTVSHDDDHAPVPAAA
jgi:Zn ribbon nucleic-acid-binding protein